MLRTILASMTLSFTTALAAAQTASPEAIAQLAPGGTLHASINYGNALLAQRDPATGELSGLSVDLARELARRLGVPVQLVPFDAAGKVTAAAKTGAWDVAFLAIDPARAADIDFTAPYLKLEGVYLVPAGSLLHTVEDVDRDGVRIAVAKGSAYDLYLTRTLKHAQLVRAENTTDAIQTFLHDKLEVVAGIRTALVLAKQIVPNGTILPGAFMTIPQAMGVPKGRPAGAHYVQEFLDAMKTSGFIAQSLERHGQQGEAELVPASSGSDR